MAKAPAGDREHSKGERQQYAPSWVDRFSAWVDGLPGPNWPYYAGMGLFLFLLQTAVVWGVGAIPWAPFFPLMPSSQACGLSSSP